MFSRAAGSHYNRFHINIVRSLAGSGQSSQEIKSSQLGSDPRMGNLFCVLIGCNGGQGTGYVDMPSQPPEPASSSHGATHAEAVADEPTVAGLWCQLVRHLLRVAYRRRSWSHLGAYLQEIRRRGRALGP